MARSGGMWGGGNSKTLKGLNPNEITIAEVLRDVGYSTAMSENGIWGMNFLFYQLNKVLIHILNLLK